MHPSKALSNVNSFLPSLQQPGEYGTEVKPNIMRGVVLDLIQQILELLCALRSDPHTELSTHSDFPS